MKSPLLVTIIINLASIAFAQVRQDSLLQRIGRTSEFANIDSLEQKLALIPDSIRHSIQHADSIVHTFNRETDGLKTSYQNVVSKIESESGKLMHKIDSLKQRNLRTGNHTKKLDSLNHHLRNTEAKFSSKLDSLKSKTTDKLNSMDLPPEYKDPLQKLTQNINGLNLNSDVVKIPALDIPGYSIPQVNGVGDLSSKVGEIPNICNPGNLPGANVPEIKTPTGDLGNLAEQTKGYQDDIKNITRGNPGDVQNLPETIENQVSEIDGVNELQKQSGIIGEQKAKLDDFKDPVKAKEKAVEMVKEKAVDHFAGKKEQLNAAMAKISKHKQKYSSVSSLKDLPKRPPNPMKGKPFIERLVPGLYLQYQQKNFYLLDVNPYVGYKLTGRFTTGLGWNHRVAYDSKHERWNKRARIFGPRGYIDFKLGKGFIAHLEGESMNSFVPSTIHGNSDAGHREWVWSFMTGIKKEYKIYKNLKGTALIQYNLFNRYYKAPYVDRLNSRIGFEYALRKRVKPKG